MVPGLFFVKIVVTEKMKKIPNVKEGLKATLRSEHKCLKETERVIEGNSRH